MSAPHFQSVKPPAVAGRFYPGSTAALRDAVDGFLREATVASAGRAHRAHPKALIVPHAGYVYSGPIAATAYQQLLGAHVQRVVLLGPAHRVAVRGLARPEAAWLETPLGRVRVDERLDQLVPWVPRSAAAHAEEHSLEVQLPFLQRVLGPDITVAPFVVGGATPGEVARVIEALWGGDETVVVVSSDLSHYLPYDHGREVDGETARAICALEELDGEQACGARPIAGLVEVARRRGLTLELLDLRSSGDTAGDRNEVVGYGAFAAYERSGQSEREGPDASARGRELLRLARHAMERAIGARRGGLEATDGDWLSAPGATFVTLRRKDDGELHGCIGSLEPRRSLGEDVQRNAASAAVDDPRAPMVGPEAARELSVEVSVLGPLEPIEARDRDELIASLRPGRDGVLLTWRGRRGTYLPQVWEMVPEPARFLGELERKAGIPRSAWGEADSPQGYRYTVEKFEEGS
jgi:hypothetical protein